MSKRVRLRYEFEFDPSKLWSNKSGFDNALNKFFESHNIEAESVTYIGSPAETMFVLSKKEVVKPQKPKFMKKPVKRKDK